MTPAALAGAARIATIALIALVAGIGQACAPAQAAATTAEVVNVASRTSVVRDPSGNLTLGDVRRGRFVRYADAHGGDVADVMRDGATWLRFRAPAAGAWYLLLPQSVRRGVAFAVRRGGVTSPGVTLGSAIAAAARPYQTDENIVRLPDALPSTVYYVRVRPATSAMGPITLLTPIGLALRERERLQVVLLPTTFFVGALMALAVLGVMLGIVLRQRSYVFYSCTLAAFGLSDFIEVGAAARWLWPHLAIPPEAAAFTGRALYGALLLVFCLTIGGPKRSFGFPQRLAIAAYGLVFVSGDIYQLWPSVVAASGLYPILDPLLNAIFLSAVYLAAVPFTLSTRARNIATMSAFTMTLIGLSAGRASASGLIPWSPLVANLPAIVLVLQAMVLSVAFARRVERVEAAEAILDSERSELEDAAMRDALTAIPNRRAFDKRIAEEWRRAAKQDTEMGLILIDVDYFKLYNDTFGHTYGDDVLHEVARAIAVGLRGKEDFVARYGGEEFIVILPSCTPDEPGRIADRLRADIEALNIQHPAAPGGMLTISAGAASASPKRFRRVSTLIEKADSALYVAKRTGRNRVSVSGSPAISVPVLDDIAPVRQAG